MKKLIILFILSFMGCAATAPTSNYRPRGSNENAWAISGSYNELTGGVIITVNGQPIIKGHVSMWNYAGEFSGNYKGKQISVSCRSIMGILSTNEECTVFIDNERATTLRF